MLRRLDLRGHEGDLSGLLPRPVVDGEGPVEAVRAIVADVRERGDAALLELGERFDGVRPTSLSIVADDLAAALDRVEPPVRAALEAAAENVRLHHEGQVVEPHEWSRGGLTVSSRAVPVERAGCYVPGGRAAYPSTVLMTAVPARVAGVDEVVVCVPPGGDGRVPDVTLAAAAIAGVDELHPIGGAQAIAALAFGTGSVRPVDVVVGPGNVYVALAKREVAGRVGVPSAFAGPSEVVVIADASAPVAFAAVDVVVQAEHGPDGLAWLVTWGPAQALAVADLIAPEHLQLMVEGAEEVAARVRHAGAVFCGPWSPASLGDYVAGPSHVLPTAGTARFSGALTVADFTKDLHVVTAGSDALADLGPHVVALAGAEGLDVHAESVRRRLAVLEEATDA